MLNHTNSFFVSHETGEIIPGGSCSLDSTPQAPVFVRERLIDVELPHNYLEYIAKTYSHEKQGKNDTEFKVDCTPMYVYGECNHHKSEQHQVMKVVRCGKEWCVTCGAKGSEVHKRRIARWWHKVLSVKVLGYLCISTPLEIRNVLKNAENLKKIRRYWVRKLKAEGFSKGLGRWHWAGESVGIWAPHLNFFVGSSYIEKERLEKWRNDYRLWIKRAFKIDLGKEVDIHFQYTDKVAKKVHLLKYVTRSTLNWFDADLARLLIGFRSTISWGKWDKLEKVDYKELDENTLKEIFESEVKSMDEEKLTYDEVQEYLRVSRLQKSLCPCCGGKITWVGVKGGNIPSDYAEIGGGYHVRVRKLKNE